MAAMFIHYMAPIIADGRARADVLTMLSQAWRDAGPHARDVFILQKFDRIVPMLTGLVADTHIEKLTMIDGRTPGVQGDGLPLKAMGTVEQIRELFGVDVVEKVKAIGAPSPVRPPMPPSR